MLETELPIRLQILQVLFSGENCSRAERSSEFVNAAEFPGSVDVVVREGPARADVYALGATTFTTSFSMVTSMPSPPNSPRVCTRMSEKSLALR